jgi:uncharacterized damage-inducible protein DinB
MSNQEIESFLRIWEFEAGLTSRLLETLPRDQYDFRPDPEGRSLGELAWHLAELEAIMSQIAAMKTIGGPPPAGIERPRTVPELATGYERVHRQAVERVRAIDPADLDHEFPFVLGQKITVRRVLRVPLLHHLIHHRGQLMMMMRLASAVPSRVYGPNREDEAAMRAERARS